MKKEVKYSVVGEEWKNNPTDLDHGVNDSGCKTGALQYKNPGEDRKGRGAEPEVKDTGAGS